ncbi:Ferritin, Dps family protein [Blyttiomyces helicus]|uniref:Ferritin n=1 Tax=Blyttiomyces helicus TaxID=388810 RepID=A0A4V1IPG4_9FUNG|nr:Ferritin, Dps family protein [Blyttiomyces helicus]|eukprot:RKO82967.1 Ferritin, Dps family protein [Blyttiomyces helicus]
MFRLASSRLTAIPRIAAVRTKTTAAAAAPRVMTASLIKSLNGHANFELQSSQFYLSLAYWFDSQNFSGFAKYYKAQSEEEKTHALKMFDYLATRGETPHLTALPAPPVKHASAAEALQAVLELEQTTTAGIHDLNSLALQEGDPATSQFMQWFIAEQVEEEDTARRFLEEVKAYDRLPGLLYHMDHFMGKKAKKVGAE